MEEAENFVKFIRGKFNQDDLKLAKFIYKTKNLSYYMIVEKVKEGDKIVEKPTSVLEFNYKKFCSDRDDDPDLNNMFEKLFIIYINYHLIETKNYWRFNLKNLDKDIFYRCSYCNVDCRACPLKLVSYIRKCIDDNKFNADEIFDKLIDKPKKEYNNDSNILKMVIDKVIALDENPMDLLAVKMLLDTDSVKIEKVENEKIYYKYLDYDVKGDTRSLFNSINEFYKNDIGISGEIDLSSGNISDYSNFLFKKSPFELAVYIKYLCDINRLNEELVVRKLLDIKPAKLRDKEELFFNFQILNVKKFDCGDEAKKQIIEILTYMRNSIWNPQLPFIPFRIALFTKNIDLATNIIDFIGRYYKDINYNYSNNSKNTIYVDCEMLVRKSRDSIDTLNQVDKIFKENGVIVLKNFEKLKTTNEIRVDSLLIGIEKFIDRQRNIVFFVDDEKSIKQATSKHPKIFNNIINRKIYIEALDVQQIKEKALKKLGNITLLDQEFIDNLDEYIKSTYNPVSMVESEYINKLCNSVIYEKYKNDKILDNIIRKNNLPKIDNTRSVDEILNDINSLVGLTEVKNNTEEILKYLEYSKKYKKEGFVNLNMIFKGNSGTGKTTVARLYAELFYKLGFIKENKLIEVTSKDLIGTHLGETAPKTQTVIESALDGVLFIDEANVIMASGGGSTSNYPAECLTTLTNAMDIYKDRLIVIFAGNTKEMNEFINLNQSVVSRVGYEIEFNDFTNEELLTIFMNNLKKDNFSIEDGVEGKIKELISKNKIGRNFGNARFIENLYKRLIVTHAANCNDDNQLNLITNRDVEIYNETKKDKDRTIEEILSDLNSLIGLETVKKTLNGFVAIMELNKKLKRDLDYNMHMIFKGNAGTGKTTVARLITEIYYNLGYIRSNKLVEVQSKDLIGQYLGQTAPKTQAVIESALDGVLFIDEAYSIMNNIGTNASYSAECIATLLKAMEDYQGRLIVIFAGYTKEMRDFRDLNPGLKSRIGYEIDFDDYTLDELMQIFDLKINKKGFKINDDAKEKVKKIIEDAKEVENFGNGRFVENTIQKIIMEHALNTLNETNYDRLITFAKEDIPDIKAEESKGRIGF